VRCFFNLVSFDALCVLMKLHRVGYHGYQEVRAAEEHDAAMRQAAKLADNDTMHLKMDAGTDRACSAPSAPSSRRIEKPRFSFMQHHGKKLDISSDGKDAEQKSALTSVLSKLQRHAAAAKQVDFNELDLNGFWHDTCGNKVLTVWQSGKTWRTTIDRKPVQGTIVGKKIEMTHPTEWRCGALLSNDVMTWSNGFRWIKQAELSFQPTVRVAAPPRTSPRRSRSESPNPQSPGLQGESRGRTFVRRLRSRGFEQNWWESWLQSSRLSYASDLEQVRTNFARCAVPHHLRPAVWDRLADMSVSLKRRYLPQALKLPQELKDQIDLDLPRTPRHIFLGGAKGADNKFPRRYEACKRLLRTTAAMLPNIGYCQGMNYLAAFLLSVLEEREAFVVLLCLLERLPANIYSNDPEALRLARLAQQERIQTALANERPALAEHLTVICLDLNLFLPRWLSALYIDVIPMPAAYRLIDRVLAADGSDAPSRLALAVICKAETQLMEVTEIEDALEVLNNSIVDVQPTDIDMMLAAFNESLQSRLEFMI